MYRYIVVRATSISEKIAEMINNGGSNTRTFLVLHTSKEKIQLFRETRERKKFLFRHQHTFMRRDEFLLTFSVSPSSSYDSPR